MREVGISKVGMAEVGIFEVGIAKNSPCKVFSREGVLIKWDIPRVQYLFSFCI